jgi:K+-transporting ATPase KdpF subunit
MDLNYLVALIVTLGVFVYLVAVLFFPERFS